jgi:hypothetical protein
METCQTKKKETSANRATVVEISAVVLNQPAIICLFTHGCGTRAPLEHTTEERSTVTNPSNQRSGIVMLDTEHVVHEHGAKYIEADISPADSKIAPALAVVYWFISKRSSSNREISRGKLGRNSLTDIAQCKILICVTELTVLTAACCCRIVQLPTGGSDILIQICTACQASWRIEHAQLSGRTYDLPSMQACRCDTGDQVSKRGNPVHEDPES